MFLVNCGSPASNTNILGENRFWGGRYDSVDRVTSFRCTSKKDLIYHSRGGSYGCLAGFLRAYYRNRYIYTKTERSNYQGFRCMVAQ